MSTAFRKYLTGMLTAAAVAFTASAAHAGAFLVNGPGALNVDTSPATQVALSSGISGAITDLNVFVHITGGHMEDFDLFLTSPDGTTVQFRADFANDQNPFVHISDPLQATFDDEAAALHSAQAGGAVGTFQAYNLLSAFDGKELFGSWILRISDTFAANEGNDLLAWSISGEVNSVPEPGTLALLGLAALGLAAARRRA